MVTLINGNNSKWVIAITGGGTGAIDTLLKNGGGSNTLLEAIVPYSKESLCELLGEEPKKYVSEHTARMMASASFLRALELAPDHDVDELYGIGVTAVMGSENQRVGRYNGARVCIMGNGVLQEFTWDFVGGTRENQEHRLTEIILELMLDCSDRSYPELRSYPKISYSLNGEVIQPDPLILLAGSFNPVHAGHRDMMKKAQGTHYELSVVNADKGTISKSEVMARLHHFHKDEKVILTNYATFAEKEKGFNNPHFIIGSDTYERVFNRDGDMPTSPFTIFKRDMDRAVDAPDNCQFVGESLPISSTMYRRAKAFYTASTHFGYEVELDNPKWGGYSLTLDLECDKSKLPVDVVIVGGSFEEEDYFIFDLYYEDPCSWEGNFDEFDEAIVALRLQVQAELSGNKWKEYMYGDLKWES